MPFPPCHQIGFSIGVRYHGEAVSPAAGFEVKVGGGIEGIHQRPLSVAFSDRG